MQKRRHLENSFQQTDPCCSTDAQPHAFLLTGPALPGTSSAASSPLKKEQPLFTLRQVGMICERLLKEREEKIREEYEEILTTKLAGEAHPCKRMGTLLGQTCGTRNHYKSNCIFG
ncbi:hypothetical protein Nmel_004599 [Mimus melanotis]